MQQISAVDQCQFDNRLDGIGSIYCDCPSPTQLKSPTQSNTALNAAECASVVFSILQQLAAGWRIQQCIATAQNLLNAPTVCQCCFAEDYADFIAFLDDCVTEGKKRLAELRNSDKDSHDPDCPKHNFKLNKNSPRNSGQAIGRSPIDIKGSAVSSSPTSDKRVDGSVRSASGNYHYHVGGVQQQLPTPFYLANLFPSPSRFASRNEAAASNVDTTQTSKDSIPLTPTSTIDRAGPMPSHPWAYAPAMYPPSLPRPRHPTYANSFSSAGPHYNSEAFGKTDGSLESVRAKLPQPDERTPNMYETPVTSIQGDFPPGLLPQIESGNSYPPVKAAVISDPLSWGGWQLKSNVVDPENSNKRLNDFTNTDNAKSSTDAKPPDSTPGMNGSPYLTELSKREMPHLSTFLNKECGFPNFQPTPVILGNPEKNQSWSGNSNYWNLGPSVPWWGGSPGGFVDFAEDDAANALTSQLPHISTSELTNILRKYTRNEIDGLEAKVRLHDVGSCKPCAFFHFPKKLCNSIKTCHFCHHEEHRKYSMKCWKRRRQRITKDISAEDLEIVNSLTNDTSLVREESPEFYRKADFIMACRSLKLSVEGSFPASIEPLHQYYLKPEVIEMVEQGKLNVESIANDDMLESETIETLLSQRKIGSPGTSIDINADAV